MASGTQCDGDLNLDILLRCLKLAWMNFGLWRSMLIEKTYSFCLLCHRETIILVFLILLLSRHWLKSFGLVLFCLHSLSLVLAKSPLGVL